MKKARIMKRYLILTSIAIVFCLTLQMGAQAGMDIPSSFVNSGVALVVLESFGLPWLVDQAMVKTGSNSNYWGTFWGTAAGALVRFTNIGLSNIDMTAFGLSLIACQVIGGVVGNKFIPLAGEQAPKTTPYER